MLQEIEERKKGTENHGFLLDSSENKEEGLAAATPLLSLKKAMSNGSAARRKMERKVERIGGR
uniref:Uncharacterized protein n=1 Tax=Nelumbo nucifera TaxID=4432 RepID=A0A822ZX81_NELNU|nr:TPA_asm: hypothetical protein HUJ06_018078 [Nelumbo nucifera]